MYVCILNSRNFYIEGGEATYNKIHPYLRFNKQKKKQKHM